MGRLRSTYSHLAVPPLSSFNCRASLRSRANLTRKHAPKFGGRPTGFRRAPLVSRQSICKPGSGWHADKPLTEPAYVTAIPLGRRLPGVSSNLPGRPALDIDPEVACACAPKPRAVPIRSCSRWGLPCRRRCRRRGALLPHLFTLTAMYATRRGGLFSVALSLGSRPPDVIRHRLSMEPGLSSPATPSLTLPACGGGKGGAGAAVRPTDRTGMGERGRAVKRRGGGEGRGRRAASVRSRPRCVSKSCSVLRVDSSTMPSTRSGRKWRWKAATASCVAES